MNTKIKTSTASKSTTKKPLWVETISHIAIIELQKQFDADQANVEEKRKQGKMVAFCADFDLYVRAYARQWVEELAKNDRKLAAKIYEPEWIQGSTQGTWGVRLKHGFDSLQVEQQGNGSWVASIKPQLKY